MQPRRRDNPSKVKSLTKYYVETLQARSRLLPLGSLEVVNGGDP
jgi:hypothetical protein